MVGRGTTVTSRKSDHVETMDCPISEEGSCGASRKLVPFLEGVLVFRERRRCSPNCGYLSKSNGENNDVVGMQRTALPSFDRKQHL